MGRIIQVGALLLLMSCSAFGAEDDWDNDDWQEDTASPWSPITGFLQSGFGTWLHSNPILPVNNSLAEIRLRLATQYTNDYFLVDLKTDLLYDHALSHFSNQVRTANVSINLSDVLGSSTLNALPLLNNVALKVGRQILSWGTGDFVFVNDMFRKDWQSFFNGRDQQYLKAPNDVIKFSYFGQFVNLDFIVQPSFNSDRYLNGQRFSFYSQQLKRMIAPSPVFHVKNPEQVTYATRLYFSHQQSDIAFYANRTFAGTPYFDAALNQARFGRLNTLGTSVITPLSVGLFKAEFAYYDYQSTIGHKPADQARLLLGYEQELFTRLSLAVQYYVEKNYVEHDISNDTLTNTRHVTTSLLNYRSVDDKWLSSLFALYSTNQRDKYIRANIQYRHSDQLNFSIGLNIFSGKPSTFFGQFDLNDNGYLKLTLNF